MKQHGAPKDDTALRIDVVTLAYLHATVLGFIGLAAGLLYGFGGLAVDIYDQNLGGGTILAFFAVPIMPVLFACVGLVLGAAEALIYKGITQLVSIKFDENGGAALKFFFALIVLAGIGMGASYLLFTFFNPEGDKGYDHKEKLGREACAAQEPECGYCPGAVIGDYCYWND